MAIALARDRHMLGGLGPRVNASSEVALFVVSVAVLVLLAVVLDRFGPPVLEAFPDSESRRRQLEAAAVELQRAGAALAQDMWAAGLRSTLAHPRSRRYVLSGCAHDPRAMPARTR